ncbi:MAG: prepilin-type N-terminal cleavage/methylation domain-containing protein [Phycisphaerales bacterium]|nr:prepilin-type N-terminal cleavage/methylation domain-containing protein [Phycisphaerales bacterium]
MTKRNTARRRRGVTLVEILVAMAIIAILLSLLIVSGRAVYRSQNRSDAQQEVMMIAAAIDKYANFWPAWEIADNNGRLVKVADRGWPDYIPPRLFDASTATSAFNVDQTGRFNSPANPGFVFALDSRAVVGFSGLIEAPGDADRLIEGNVLNANICLAYALTSKTGKGPYLEIDDSSAILRDVVESVPTYSPTFPRPATGVATALHARSDAGHKLMLVDPWGTPYRYFWVYRKYGTASGFGPVAVANINLADDSPAAANNDAVFHRAVGYVLESAGPDRKFGNRWIINPTQADIDEAADNLVVQRP